MNKKKIKKPKYPQGCGGKRGKGCSTISEELMRSKMKVVAGRNCGKGCHRRKSWETMIGKSFESRLAA